jgi:hypothetical protein
VRARAIAALGLLALAAGCAPARLAATAPAAKPRWTLVAPAGVAQLPDVQRLIATRRASATVEVLSYDRTTGDARSRLEAVRAQLAARTTAAPEGGDFILIVGSPQAISSGPWRFEGVETPIASDWPLAAGLAPQGETIARDAWTRALERPAPRFVGRIPFDDPGAIAGAVRATLEHADATAAARGHALLASTTTGGSWVLSGPRDRLRELGWHAQLAGPSGACDRTLALAAAAPGHAPVLVCTAGPVELAPLLSTHEPALVVAFAPAPALDQAAGLLASGDLAGVAGFTTAVEASPLSPALETMRAVPPMLAEGGSIGAVMECTRSAYWNRARGDVAAQLPPVARARALAALGATLYGDPAVQVAHSHPAAAEVPASAALPLVVPAAETPAQETRAPAEGGLPSWIWPALVAAAVGGFALLVTATSRRDQR